MIISSRVIVSLLKPATSYLYLALETHSHAATPKSTCASASAVVDHHSDTDSFHQQRLSSKAPAPRQSDSPAAARTPWASPPPPLPAQPPPPRHPAVAAGFAETTPTSPFSQQRERLILELFPFKDAGKFHEWLRGGPVQGSWREFQRDLLARLPADGDRPDPGPDKARMAQATKDAINARSQKFLVYHPDKSGWSPEDHHVRFMTTVIMDSLLANLWSDSDWKKKNLDIYKAVYEVLFFLKASHYMNQQAPPSYSD